MTLLISFSILVLITSVTEIIALDIGPSCQIEGSVSSGNNSVVITLTPSPMEVIQAAGLSESESVSLLIDLLDSGLNPAFVVAAKIPTQMAVLIKTYYPLEDVTNPTCRFKWISNELFCDNVPGVILQPLCDIFEAITHILSPINFPLPIHQIDDEPLNCTAEGKWGLAAINTPKAGDSGTLGDGIVVANLDTGVRSTHEELVGNIRAGYNWFNAYDPNNPTPLDDVGHGTHTIGSICGKTVGVAPRATWIACRGCNPDGCGMEQLTDCGQWLLCPDRQVLNCTTRPNVINNSWGGVTWTTFYQSALSLMKQAGIINLFSTGNNGPACGTLLSPANWNASKWGIISVGATSCDDKIASFSSAGPSKSPDNLGGLGVNVVGPGKNIFSAWNESDTATNVLSGTSQSCPHAAGAVAILLSRNSSLGVDEIRSILETSAFKNPEVKSSLNQCTTSNASNPGPWPNNIYGYGRIDILAALNYSSSE